MKCLRYWERGGLRAVVRLGRQSRSRFRAYGYVNYNLWFYLSVRVHRVRRALSLSKRIEVLWPPLFNVIIYANSKLTIDRSKEHP